MASHLTPPGKGNSEVRPIGVGEVIRITGKCVTKVTKQEILELSGLLQVCTEHKSGSEAAVHVMNSLFLHEETDAVLLVDVSNTFNLSWQEHTKSLLKSFNKKIAVLRTIKFLPSSILQTIYFRTVLPSALYEILVWGSCSPALMDDLKLAQIRASKLIFKLSRNSNDLIN